ncbi:hypothetical protein AC529_12295, partial [Thermobifida cellulosilytica TB100]
MAYEEHDGSEHLGARSPRSEHGDPALGSDTGGERYEESDEWFGDDDFDLDLIAPPPPYAQTSTPGSAAPFSPAPQPAAEQPRPDLPEADPL